MYDLGRLTETTGYFAADDRVRPFDLLVYRFAQVMQQCRCLTHVHIRSKLVRNGARELGADVNVCKTARSEEHTSELQSHSDLVCRLLLEKKKISPSGGAFAWLISETPT